ncbi:hypothetical protein BsWGS_15566 [Bradybaena similaris]
MSISPARLLARNCCICLLLSLASVTTGTISRSTPNSSANTGVRNKNSNFHYPKGKCQFNLTDSSQSLEVESSAYQDQGFSRCEYIIQAPSSRFILLNFTDIRSQSDMPVGTGVLRQQFQQAATLTTPIAKPTFTKAHLVKPINDNQKHSVNATNLSSYHIDQPVSTVVAHKSGDTIYPESAHNNRTDNSGIFPSGNDSHTRDLPIHKSSLEDVIRELPNKETNKSNTSFLNKTSDSSAIRKNSYSGLTTSSESLDRVDVHTEPAVLTHNCSLQIIIEEVNGTTGTDPQVICWRKLWRKRIPIVFQYSVPIRITYVWDRNSQSGFSLDFSFLRPEEANCLFRCNNHLCLPKKQLCDGFSDCPDHSDEHNTACSLAGEHEENGEPHIIKVVIIIISVIVGVIIVLALVFMISHSHCHDGAHQGGGPLLQPPHSQSSEVCRSPSDSMQDSGQYEALLHHQQRQTTTANFAINSSHCMEQQQFLQQQQHHLDVEQQQQPQYHCRSNQTHCVSRHPYMSQEQLIRSLSFSAERALPSASNPQASRPLQHQQQLQHQHLLYQQHSEDQQQQHRQCKQTQKYVSPSELYPPNIPLSADGEEGYAMSQKALHSKQQLERNWQVQNEVFRPPPNKTVHDRDSPPPPYSLNPPGTKSLDSLVPPVGVVCVLRHARSSLMPEASASGVSRSHSLSCHQ